MKRGLVLRARGHTRAATRGRVASLDGMRAFAVTAVLLYHAGVPGVGGGLLGVDVFFVLSGFLITSLLCGEFAARATVRLRHFWAGRARRLLPALFVLLLAVSVYALLLRGSVNLSGLRGDAISTLLYVANWHFVFSGQSYFAQSTAPSPLLHMWSLGVEEQYYLLWPLVALLVLRRRGPRALVWVAGVGAAASALLMASLYLVGFSADRLYYGTDTRAQALLVGSALGALASSARRTTDPRARWRVIPLERTTSRAARLAGGALGAAGAGWLLWSWHEFDGQGPFLYGGGFLLVALATAAVITVVTSWRGSLLARVCSVHPVAYVGRISYGVYLYHWPLFLAIDHAHTGLRGGSLLAARLGATFVAAVVSFHAIEEPIRTRRLVRDWRGLALGAAGAVGTAAVVVVATVAPAAATAKASEKASTVSSAGMSASERQQLLAAGAFTTRPIRFVLTGDSVAVTAGVGLSDLSKTRFGVQVDDEGGLGCDLDTVPSRLGGRVVTNPECAGWPSIFAQLVDRTRPDVAGLLIGRFELADHLWDGRWMHVGQPVWDAHLEAELDQAVAVLSSRGARVALFTFPYIDPPLEQPDGAPYPENEPSRVDAFNRLLRRVAFTHPGTVGLVDLGRMLDPAGHFTQTIDGISVRWPDDGIHVSADGGVWLQPRVLPQIAALGLESRSNRRG